MTEQAEDQGAIQWGATVRFRKRDDEKSFSNNVDKKRGGEKRFGDQVIVTKKRSDKNSFSKHMVKTRDYEKCFGDYNVRKRGEVRPSLVCTHLRS